MANMRISGLASGMDIDSIVSDMMKVKRMPLDKLKQQKQTMEWQRDDYREMNTLLLNFRSELTQMKLSSKYRTRTTTTTDDSKVTATATSAAALSSYSIQSVSQLATAATKVNYGSISKAGSKVDTSAGLYSIKDQFHLNSDTNFGWKQGSVESKTFTVTDANNVSIGLQGVTIKTLETDPSKLEPVNVKVDGISYKVVSTNAELKAGEVFVKSDGTLEFSDGAIKAGSTIKVDYVANQKTDTLKFSDPTNNFSLTKGSLKDISSFNVNGSVYYISKTSGSEWDIFASESDRDANTNSIGKINPATGQITGFSLTANSTVEVTYTQNYFDFNIKTYSSEGNEVSENFFIQGSESLNNVINKVNSANVGVSMFHDSFTDKVTLTRTETGDFNKGGPEIITTGSFINEVLRFSHGTETGGTNAIFTINGLQTERNSNTFAINGVTFTLKQTFNETGSSTATPVTIAINNDNNTIFENIKGFIDKYNELIGKIQEKTQQERYKGYTPLTDEQREQLSDKQQEQWEEKAKSGLLRRDQTLTSLLSSMRMDFYGKVESEKINPVYSQLASIGIKTTANYLEGGKLEINEAQLKKAIEEDPESIEALFNASGTTNGQKGIAQRLYDTVGRTMDVLYEKAGKSYSTNNQFTIGKQLNNINDQIDSLEDRLTAIEDRYYRQFTAMEKAIQNANQQSAYITQNFFS